MERTNRRRHYETDIKRFEATRRAYIAQFQRQTGQRKRRPKNEGRMVSRPANELE